MQAVAIGIVNNLFIFTNFVKYIGILFIVPNRRIVIHVRVKIYGSFKGSGNIKFWSFILATLTSKNIAGLKTVNVYNLKHK